MKKIFLLIGLMFITLSLISCNEEKEMSEEEYVQTNETFKNAIKMNQEFEINNIKAKVVEVNTNPLYAGNNKNKNMMGVYVYIDYPKSVELSSNTFKVVDIKGNVYTHLTTDGLDFLGKNRGENGNLIGYYRVSLPNMYQNFLLTFTENNKVTNIHIVVNKGE